MLDDVFGEKKSMNELGYDNRKVFPNYSAKRV